MNVISKSMAVCGALFLGAVAAHAQYFKIYQKSGHAVSFYAEEVDSVTTGERYGDFYHRVFLRGSEGETTSCRSVATTPASCALLMTATP